ncbi:MAG TPA: FAD-dependent oxidoreductase [Phenylobacterium sp.]
MTARGRVTVAGAGVLGLSTAVALADAGLQVTVWDLEPFGRASAVAAGMLAPAFEAALEPEGSASLDLLLAARNAWPGLAQRTGIYLDRTGAVAVGGEAWLGQVAAALIRLGVRPADLGPATLAGLAPGLSPAIGRGLLVREDWRLEPRPALAALRAAAEAAGVVFRTERVEGRGDADVLVIAGGLSRGLADVAPEVAQLSPIRGQILSYAGKRGSGVCVRTEGAYATPGSDGLAVGATMEPGREDLEPDANLLAPLSAAAGRLFPRLAQATPGVQVGVRAATPDGLPMVGWSSAPGVVLAVGARRNGWLLAPLIAQVVTACVTGRDPGPYAARLDPGRFAAGGQA